MTPDSQEVMGIRCRVWQVRTARPVHDGPVSTAEPGSPEPRSDGAGPQTPPTSPPPTPGRRASGLDADGHVKGSRSGALYIGLILAAVLAILVLVFIVQNSESTTIRFLGFEGSLPLGVGVLLAAVAGMLIVALPGSIRIIQLRRSLAKNEKRARDAS